MQRWSYLSAFLLVFCKGIHNCFINSHFVNKRYLITTDYWTAVLVMGLLVKVHIFTTQLQNKFRNKILGSLLQTVIQEITLAPKAFWNSSNYMSNIGFFECSDLLSSVQTRKKVTKSTKSVLDCLWKLRY